MNLAQNNKLRKLLTDRWDELSMKPAKVMDDAMERAPHLKFARSRFSHYKNGDKGSFTDEQMVWLCVRWGIEINVNFGIPYLNEKNGLAWKILPYSELDCITQINKLFPKVADVKKKPAKKVKKPINKKV